MLNKVQDTIVNHNLIKEGEKVIVALSGGPDSVCLTHLLHKLSSQLGFEIILAHLNHNMRGKESDQDAQFVKKLAKKISLSLSYQKLEKKPQNENEARRARYQFLEKVRDKNKAQKIATGHTASDQVETILLHFLRGAGIKGIAGMDYQKNKIIRPLLDCDREEILSYLKENQIHHRLDRTNLDPKILRNRIRLKLIPLLEAEYNPQIRKNLTNLGNIARETQNFIEKEARKFLQKHPSQFPLKSWQELSPIMKREVLRQALKETKGNLQDIYAGHIEEIIKMLNGLHGNKKKEFQGLRIFKKDGKITVVKIQSGGLRKIFFDKYFVRRKRVKNQ